MANYVYADTNTDLDLTFETENLGQISASGTTADYGSLTATPTNLLANTPLLAESDIDGDRGEIVNQSISPIGAVASMTSTTNEAFARTSYLGSGNIAASGMLGSHSNVSGLVREPYSRYLMVWNAVPHSGWVQVEQHLMVRR